jgi:predicted NBD/HSP70 family sugar kinase
MNKRARNAAYMKFSNRQHVMNILRKNPVSRADLSRITGLTRASISQITDVLLSEGAVIESGTGEARYGRKPLLLEINPDYRYSVGLDLSREGCYAGIVSITGNLVQEARIDIDSASNAESALGIISDQLQVLIKSSGIPREKFLGIGISAPGPLDTVSGKILNPPNFNMWHGVSVVEILKKSFPMDIYLENHSNALALAEKIHGLGRDMGSFILLVADTGVGAGIVINEVLYRGAGGFGSELGHTSIDMNGEKCACGNIGCLELYASIPAVLKRLKLQKKRVSSWKNIVDRANRGNSFYIDVIRQEARHLSVGIVNAVNLLEPEAVILAGHINYKPGMLLDIIREEINSMRITRGIRNIEVTASAITSDTRTIASAAVMTDRYFTFQQ